MEPAQPPPNLRHRQPWYEFLDRRVHVDEKRGGARPRGRRNIVLIFCRVREQPFALILKLRFTQVHTTQICQMTNFSDKLKD